MQVILFTHMNIAINKQEIHSYSLKKANYVHIQSQ